MSFQIQLKLDLKKLYEALCPECKKKLIKILKEGISDDIILAAMGVTKETKPIPMRRRKKEAVAEAIPPPES